MPVSSLSSGSTSTEESPYYKANQAEKEANARVQAANELVKKTEIQTNTELDHLRDRFETRYSQQKLNEEQILDANKTKGYEELRNLQKQYQADLRQQERTNQLSQQEREETQRTLLHTTELKSQEKLTEALKENNTLFDYEKTNSDNALETLKSKNSEKLQEMKSSQEQEILKAQTENETVLKDTKEKDTENKLKLQNTVKDSMEAAIKEQNQTLDTIYSTANEKLTEIRRDTAEKLSAYSSRQSDPFYKMMSITASLRDTGDEYILVATVPQYEQEHISAAVKGDNLVISGYRRNEETIKDDSGHSQGTASFQSFHESFPLAWPVEGKQLTREHQGDQVIIKVPKMNRFAFKEPEITLPKKVRVEAPNFPKNIRKT